MVSCACAATHKNGLKNKGAHNDVLYVVFYKLSYDTSYFSNEQI